MWKLINGLRAPPLKFMTPSTLLLYSASDSICRSVDNVSVHFFNTWPSPKCVKSAISPPSLPVRAECENKRYIKYVHMFLFDRIFEQPHTILIWPESNSAATSVHLKSKQSQLKIYLKSSCLSNAVVELFLPSSAIRLSECHVNKWSY